MVPRSESLTRRGLAPLGLILLFVLTRIGVALAGVRFDLSGLTGRVDYFQLLDVHDLRHHLVQSLWNLQSQPPLFNLWSGLLIRLPSGLIGPTMTVMSWAFGVALLLSCFYLCLALKIHRYGAIAITTIVILDPANLLYANWYFDTYPTAVLMTFSALAIARYIGTRSRLWGASFFCSVTLVVLFNSSFQWFWVVLVAAPVVWFLRAMWRTVLLLAVLPMLVVIGWYAKNAVLFGTYSTSSWLGMNVARITTAITGPPTLPRLIASGRLTPLAAVQPFLPLRSYHGQYSAHAATGVAVLDAPVKHDGAPNFNNINYIAVSSQFLKNDLAFVRAEPLQYAHSLQYSTRLFFFPTDRYFFLWPNASHLTSYADTYDFLVGWQMHPSNFAITITPKGGTDVIAPRGSWGPQHWSQVSLLAVAAFGMLGFLGPIAIWLRRRDHAVAAALFFIWSSSAYIFLLTSLMELGENMRFRYALGPLPLVGAVAVVCALIPRLNAARGSDALSAP